MLSFKDYIVEARVFSLKGYGTPSLKGRLAIGDWVVVDFGPEGPKWQPKRSLRFDKKVGTILGQNKGGMLNRYAVKFLDGSMEGFHSRYVKGPFKDQKEAEDASTKLAAGKPVVLTAIKSYKSDVRKTDFESALRRVFTEKPFNYTWLETPKVITSRKTVITILAEKVANRVQTSKSLPGISDAFNNFGYSGVIQDQVTKLYPSGAELICRVNSRQTGRLKNVYGIKHIIDQEQEPEASKEWRYTAPRHTVNGMSSYIWIAPYVTISETHGVPAYTISRKDTGARREFREVFDGGKGNEFIKKQLRTALGVLNTKILKTDRLNNLKENYEILANIDTVKISPEKFLELAFKATKDKHIPVTIATGDGEKNYFEGYSVATCLYYRTGNAPMVLPVVTHELSIIGNQSSYVDLNNVSGIKPLPSYITTKRPNARIAISLQHCNVNSVKDMPSFIGELKISECKLNALKDFPAEAGPNLELSIRQTEINGMVGLPRKIHRLSLSNCKVNSVKGAPEADYIWTEKPELREELVKQAKAERVLSHGVDDEVRDAFGDILGELL